jgi:uncharacterized membrane protein YcaP (DUF421 family)
MFPGWHVLLQILLRTAAIYAVVLIGVRLSGKREVGQMTPFDLTLLLLISNAVQNAMTGPDTSLLGGVVAAGTLLVLNYFVAELSGANRRFQVCAGTTRFARARWPGDRVPYGKRAR